VNLSETRTALSRCCLAFLFCLFLSLASVWPQGNQGTIEASSSIIRCRSCRRQVDLATNGATGIHFQTTSDSDGLFTFPVLPVGTYTIEVEHPGFAKLTQKNITLSVGARLESEPLALGGWTDPVRHRHG